MSRRRKDKIPNLITSKEKIARISGRYPRPRFRPLCSECNNPTMVASIQRGLKKKEPKRGRPPKDKNNNNRHERVGRWCVECELFFYNDGSADYRERLEQ